MGYYSPQYPITTPFPVTPRPEWRPPACPTPPVVSPAPQNINININVRGGVSDDTRNFLMELRTFLKQHGHAKAAQDVLDHIDDEDAKTS